MKEQTGEWYLASSILGVIVTLAVPVAVLLYYLPWIGASVVPLFAVPASLIYAVCIGRLAARSLEIDPDMEVEPAQSRK